MRTEVLEGNTTWTRTGVVMKNNKKGLIDNSEFEFFQIHFFLAEVVS